jgi:O-acetyl-ADP-ribose deacetylase (regulator of RNase III)
MFSLLSIQEYSKAIKLNEKTFISPMTNKKEALFSVLQQLGVNLSNDCTEVEALYILHGILAPMDAKKLSSQLTKVIENIAVSYNITKAITQSKSIPFIEQQYTSSYPARNKTSLWVGDITHLKVDAIVNAANSELLGCRQPNHACIDNIIHSAAGPRLRDDCAKIIEKQGTNEPTGNAKVTRGYALSAKYVLHTVGPQLYPGSQPTHLQKEQLKNSYRSCLDTASNVKEIRSIAFCAISTGVFSYPRKQAAKIALSEVAHWLTQHPHRFDKVIFNLYSNADAEIYQELLNGWK